MKKNDELMSCVGMVVSAIMIVIIGAVANGWALSTIWNWFIPPIFGLTTLTIWQAVGVSFVLSMFVGSKRSSSGEESKLDTTERIIKTALEVVFTPILYVAIAFVIVNLAF